VARHDQRVRFAIVASSPAPLSASTAAQILSAASAGSDEFLGALDGTAMLVVELGTADDQTLDLLPGLPGIVVGFARAPVGPAPIGVDVALTPGDPLTAPPGWVAVADVEAEIERLCSQINRAPLAAVVLAQVLRRVEDVRVDDGLVVESLAYSTLQSGPEFATWLGHRPSPSATNQAEPEPAVLVDRHDDRLTIMLNRPQVRNAVNRRVRDELCAALALVCADDSIRHVDLSGVGPDFSSGGDLDEFGTRPDSATAHLTRVGRSPARLMAAAADRVTTHVHGACIGAGIELAAFSHHVVAASDSRFLLPEIGLGLIPGSGGTVSIRRRIGRQRTAWLALHGGFVDVAVAHRWGLVDVVANHP
jgi:enoyl-CoA hydratase/carnithine racemase